MGAHWRLGLVGLGVFAVLLTGCGGFKQREVTSAEDNIQKIAFIYSQYSSAHNKPPRNVEDLKGWVKKLSKEKQQDLGVDDVEAAFTSPRDKQPYVIVPLRVETAAPDAAVAYEKVGQGGKRWVVNSQGSTWEVEEGDLDLFVPGKR